MPFQEEEVLGQLVSEVGLEPGEARLYLEILGKGALPAAQKQQGLAKLVEKGMVILSGDNSRFIPVHPRLAIANHYRSWRESMIKEMNDRRMRVDRLILRLIPVYEATIDKKLADK